MGNCYSAAHIAENRIHTDKKYNTEEPQQKYREEPQQKYRLVTVSNRLLGGGAKTCFTGSVPSPFVSDTCL